MPRPQARDNGPQNKALACARTPGKEEGLPPHGHVVHEALLVRELGQPHLPPLVQGGDGGGLTSTTLTIHGQREQLGQVHILVVARGERGRGRGRGRGEARALTRTLLRLLLHLPRLLLYLHLHDCCVSKEDQSRTGLNEGESERGGNEGSSEGTERQPTYDHDHDPSLFPCPRMHSEIGHESGRVLVTGLHGTMEGLRPTVTHNSAPYFENSPQARSSDASHLARVPSLLPRPSSVFTAPHSTSRLTRLR